MTAAEQGRPVDFDALRLGKLVVVGQAIARRTRDRLESRSRTGRELSEPVREALIETALDLESIATALRSMARPRAAFSVRLVREVEANEKALQELTR